MFNQDNFWCSYFLITLQMNTSQRLLSEVEIWVILTISALWETVGSFSISGLSFWTVATTYGCGCITVSSSGTFCACSIAKLGTSRNREVTYQTAFKDKQFQEISLNLYLSKIKWTSYFANCCIVMVEFRFVLLEGIGHCSNTPRLGWIFISQSDCLIVSLGEPAQPSQFLLGKFSYSEFNNKNIWLILNWKIWNGKRQYEAIC